MMQKLSFSVFLGLLLIDVAACGGKVVIDSASAGGAGGTGQGGSGLSSSNASGSSTSSASSSSSSSSGQPSPCDLSNSCDQCVNCTVDMVCVDQWAKCSSVPACIDLMYCLASCPDAQVCQDKCLSAYPQGVDLYKETAQCVICQACVNDCQGLTKNCP